MFLGFFPRDQYLNRLLLWLLFSSIAVTISSSNNPGFMQISGYYGVKCKANKIFAFVSMILLYSWFDLILRITYGAGIGLETMVKGVFPLLTGKYWYATAYLVLMILSPVINLLCEKADKVFHKRIVMSVVFLFMLVPTFLYWGPNGEYSVDFVVMIVYYILIQYMKKYDLLTQVTSRKLLGIAVADFIFMVSGNFVLSYFAGASMPFGFFMPFSRACSVFMFIFSACVFELFRRKKFYNAVINNLADYVFSAYILDGTIRMVLEQYVDVYNLTDNFSARLGIMVLYVIVIFLLAMMIEFIRRKTIWRFEERWYQNLVRVRKTRIMDKI